MKKEQALQVIKQALELAIGSGKNLKLEEVSSILNAFQIISSEVSKSINETEK